MAILYRVLTPHECSKFAINGLVAKDPFATMTVEDFVSTGSNAVKSQFISTSRTLEASRLFASHSYDKPRFIAAIDIDMALQAGSIVQIIDISTRENARQHISTANERAVNFAAKFEEILIKGSIPASCIKIVEKVE